MAQTEATRLPQVVTGPTRRPWRKRLTPAFLLAPGILIIVFLFLWSMAILLKYSFYSFAQGQLIRSWSLDSWQRFLTDSYYWSILWETARLGFIVTGLSILIGYPVAYTMARIRQRWLLIPAYILIFSPLLVSVVVRSYGWILMLSEQGVINKFLMGLHITDSPQRLVFNELGVTISLVHILMPFAIFPMVSVLTQLPPNLKEASADLGATRLQTFYKVVLPLSLPGIIAAAQIVFTLTISAFVTPSLLGGGRVQVLSRLVYDNITQLNWPLGAVEAFVLLGMALVVIFIFNRLNRVTYAARER